MRFHLIDRIDCIDPYRAISARKITSRLESFWRDVGRGPEMPAPLVLEALCQAGTWLVMASTELRLRAALLSVDEVSFDAPVRPGDVLALDGVVESMNEQTAVLSGRVSVGDRTVLTARAIMCALMAVEELEDVESVRLMRLRLQPQLTGVAA